VDPVASYDLTLSLQPDQHALSVTGEVELPPQPEASQSIELTITATAGPITWRSAGPAGTLLQASAGAPERGRVTWTIRVAREPGKPIKLGFSYRILAPEAVRFIYIGQEVSFGVGFYPQNRFHTAKGVLRVRAPLSGQVFASGNVIESRRESGAQTRTFQSTLPARELFFGFAPGAKVTEFSSPNLSLVTLRSRQSDSEWGKRVAAVAAALEAEFGQIPYERATVMEIPNAVSDKLGSGAFATSGAIFTRSSYLDQPFNIAFFAHEMSHFWWGNNVVHEGETGDFLMDEGLAQYGAISAVERVVGPTAGTRFRREGWPGFDENLYNGSAYLQMAAASFDRPLLQLQVGSDYLAHWLIYSKGGLVWYALAQEMGPQQFRLALQQIQRTHGGGAISWNKFITMLRRHSSRDLDPFLEAWFAQPGAPTFSLDWTWRSGEVHGRIEQTGSVKPASMELAITSCRGVTTTTLVRVSGPVTPFSAPSNCRPRKVELDPHYKILRWTEDLRVQATALTELMRGWVLNRLGRSVEAEEVLAKLLATHPENDSYDRAILANATLARLTEQRNCPACSKTYVTAALALRPSRPARLAGTYLSLAAVAQRIGQPMLASRAAKAARETDSLVGGANGADSKLRQLNL
jgi:tetratricopeptide (TPR) repeat protein